MKFKKDANIDAKIKFKFLKYIYYLWKFVHPQANCASIVAVDLEISNTFRVSKREGVLSCLPVDMLEKSIFNCCICNDGCPLLTS